MVLLIFFLVRNFWRLLDEFLKLNTIDFHGTTSGSNRREEKKNPPQTIEFVSNNLAAENRKMSRIDWKIASNWTANNMNTNKKRQIQAQFYFWLVWSMPFTKRATNKCTEFCWAIFFCSFVLFSLCCCSIVVVVVGVLVRNSMSCVHSTTSLKFFLVLI